MKYLVALFILFFSTLQTFGQQEYFIYVQTDNSQAFYIRINKNIYSSSASGYLILSKLPDSTANITIGFAGNVFPEQYFNIPVNHKDAGYLLKNGGEKGWRLLNLQTMAVITNSNPEQEKKSPEITGTRRNDAFSLLLANAVSDTAVLYTVTKPKKTPAPPMVSPEKKTDTLSVVNAGVSKKDSTAFVKIPPEKTDSAITAVNTPKPVNDTAIAANTGLTKPGETVTSAKNSPSINDSIAIREKIAFQAPVTKNTVPPEEAVTTAKKLPAQRKDTIIITNTTTPEIRETAAAKNKNARKDTIIIMQGRDSENTQLAAKNVLTKKENVPLPQPNADTLHLKKQVLIAPEEKRNALQNNRDAVIIQKIPVKKDSLAALADSKKDTLETLAKNNTEKPAETKTDTVVNFPVKRLRPLINKAAEVFTDTSYVAVFVDESRDKFDTIRISIAFNYITAPPAKEQPPQKELPSIDTAPTSKITRDSTPLLTGGPVAKPALKTGTLPADNIIKDSIRGTAAQPKAAPLIKKDTVPVLEDSGWVVKAPPQVVILNSDCKETAVDNDIDKLRIKMLLMVSDEDRINVAKKVYRQKCFLVRQVMALSELFRTDEGKYKWFDVIYPFVSDSGNFYSLVIVLKDSYYINRFKAMLRN